MDCAWMGDGTVMELRANCGNKLLGQADLGEGDTRLGGDCFFGSGGVDGGVFDVLGRRHLDSVGHAETSPDYGHVAERKKPC